MSSGESLAAVHQLGAVLCPRALQEDGARHGTVQRGGGLGEAVSRTGGSHGPRTSPPTGEMAQVVAQLVGSRPH